MVDGEISGPTSVPKCHSPKYAELDVTKVTGNPILEKKGCSLIVKKSDTVSPLSLRNEDLPAVFGYINLPPLSRKGRHMGNNILVFLALNNSLFSKFKATLLIDYFFYLFKMDNKNALVSVVFT